MFIRNNPSNYSLEIISHHAQFKNKSLKQYHVDGQWTVGAWGDEPFEVKFKNNTSKRLQVKLSLDGTDILTGSPAGSAPSAKMWVVEAYGILSLKAWPENNNGGSQFVFTSADNSVAAHTHGNLSSRGIIAAAVYEEGHMEAIRVNRNNYFDNRYSYDFAGGGILRSHIGGQAFGSTVTNSVKTKASLDLNDDDGSYAKNNESFKELVAIGAGNHVEQKITYVAGLKKPVLSEVLQVKYLWWDDLKAKLEESNHVLTSDQPNGFPADEKIMSIGSTPKVGQYKGNAFPKPVTPQYSRV